MGVAYYIKLDGTPRVAAEITVKSLLKLISVFHCLWSSNGRRKNGSRTKYIEPLTMKLNSNDNVHQLLFNSHVTVELPTPILCYKELIIFVFHCKPSSV
jgi:hypothetical protein